MIDEAESYKKNGIPKIIKKTIAKEQTLKPPGKETIVKSLTKKLKGNSSKTSCGSSHIHKIW
mgnify:CR=1 FL=1